MVLSSSCYNICFYIQGIEAARVLESEGIQTHLTFVYRHVTTNSYSPSDCMDIHSDLALVKEVLFLFPS